MRGIIIKGLGGLYSVRTAEGLIECRARGLFRKEKITPLVGDFVTVDNQSITEILPRKNYLSRPPCANIDKLFIVCAVANPNPSIYNVDRMLVIAEYFGIEPVLIFSKTDLEDTFGIRSVYSDLPVKSYEICSFNPDYAVIDRLKGEIAGCTVALSGVSGVGKSTFMNLIEPEAAAETGEISEKLGRGRNTTRHTELYETCGGRIMDTPGFSGIDFEAFGIRDRSRLTECFAEFGEVLEDGCRFSDCRHISEPDCALRKAVEDGRIHKSRYDSFVKMYEDIGPMEDWKNK